MPPRLTALRTYLVFLFACLLTACQFGSHAAPMPGDSSTATLPPEIEVQEIPLTGPASTPKAEISGMAWYGDVLIFLPQYPDRFGISTEAAVFALDRSVIIDYLSGSTTSSLEPETIQFVDGGLHDSINGYEGFEAIAFHGNIVYLTIEARQGKMKGYLVSGSIQPDLSEIRLDPASLTEIPLQADLKNISDESLLVYKDEILTLFETNGALVNPSPSAHKFSLSEQLLGALPFPNLEFRITDAAPPDRNGYFWAINNYFPLDKLKLKPQDDILAERYGLGKTHLENLTVERLVQFQIMENEIRLVDIPPVQLHLEGDIAPRNWEALALLDSRGFLIATDKFPRTIFGFVPFPVNK